MKVYQRLSQAFKAEGTTNVFGMMGDGNMYWQHENYKNGIVMHEVRHEGAGLGMADGWARVTRQPGVATATCGPGVTQLATALVTAARASSPLVAFCGEYPVSDDEYTQRLDQAAFAHGCEAAFVRMATPDAADDAVRKAFYIARLESRPVMLSVPMDLQQKDWDDDEPYRPSTSLLPTAVVQPHPLLVEQAADMICKAKKPIILAGRGAMWSNAGDAVRALAKRTGALIATSLMAKAWLADDEYHIGISGTYATRTAMHLCEESDCVIAIGASLNRYTTEHGYLYPNAKFIHIDSKPHVMMSGGRGAELYVQADGRSGVEAIEAELNKREFQQTGFRNGEVKERLANAWEDRREYPLEPGTLDPRQVCLALDELIPTDISLFSGSGSTAGFTNILFRKPRPMVLPGHFFGCIGQMMPAAIGAIIAKGMKPAILLDGDASTMMHIGEFETMVRYKVPLLIFVMNNQCLGAEYYKLDAHNMDKETSVISTPDLGAVATAFGGRGCIARTVDEVKKATAQWLANPGPMIIDVRVSRSVVTLPYRRIHYGEDE
ncbi:MAG: thiamine pyrophosphate-binding protein [Betaproteobacteria bacterium]|jgi:thiamine pyrophosphate-dependent acetolactate synthase large subunit-like protein